MRSILSSKVALPLFVILGVAATVGVVKLKPAMKHDKTADNVPLVSVVSTKKELIRPSIIGYGTVEPDVNLQTKAEVAGRVTFVASALKTGAIVAANTQILRIDDKDYLLALRQAKADLLANKASLQQMQLNIKNTEVDIQLAKKKLAVAKAEYKRKQRLHKKGTVSKSELEAQEKSMLQQEQETQNLQGKLKTLPADLEVLKAKISISEAKVAQAKRDIDRTKIVVPYSVRIGKVNVELGQFVSKGSTLFEASSFDKMQINAQFQLDDFRRLLATVDKSFFNIQNIIANEDFAKQLSNSGLSAVISNPNSKDMRWVASVERISGTIDNRSRTVGVIVGVDNNYKNLDPTKKPPLVGGMYLQVKIKGVAKPFVAIPRAAIRQKEVFIADAENNLRRLSAVPDFIDGDVALFSNSLPEQSKVIVSDVYPAISGMPLHVIEDKFAVAQLADFMRRQK